MIIQIFAVYDSKAKAYNTPFFMHTKEMAIREFTNASISSESIFFNHPLDYTLFHLGEYNDEIAHMESLTAPDFLITSTQAQSAYANTSENLKRIKSIQEYEGSTVLGDKTNEK